MERGEEEEEEEEEEEASFFDPGTDWGVPLALAPSALGNAVVDLREQG